MGSVSASRPQHPRAIETVWAGRSNLTKPRPTVPLVARTGADRACHASWPAGCTVSATAPGPPTPRASRPRPSRCRPEASVSLPRPRPCACRPWARSSVVCGGKAGTVQYEQDAAAWTEIKTSPVEPVTEELVPRMGLHEQHSPCGVAVDVHDFNPLGHLVNQRPRCLGVGW